MRGSGCGSTSCTTRRGSIWRRGCGATVWWGAEYERLAAVESIDRTLAVPSEVLGLELRAKVGGEMRFHDPATGESLLSHGEEHAARRSAERRAEAEHAARLEETAARRAEAAARRVAEARVAELEARLREGR